MIVEVSSEDKVVGDAPQNFSSGVTVAPTETAKVSNTRSSTGGFWVRAVGLAGCVVSLLVLLGAIVCVALLALVTCGVIAVAITPLAIASAVLLMAAAVVGSCLLYCLEEEVEEKVLNPSKNPQPTG